MRRSTDDLYRHIDNITDYRTYHGALYQRVTRPVLEARLLNQHWPPGMQISTIAARNLADAVIVRAPVLGADHAD